jgi:hypothetical protein
MDSLEHLNNMTVLQQGAPELDSGARADVVITPANPGIRDNPSLFNEPARPNNSVTEYTSAKQDTPLTASGVNSDPRQSASNGSESLKGLEPGRGPGASVTNEINNVSAVNINPAAGAREHALHNSVADHTDVNVNTIAAPTRPTNTTIPLNTAAPTAEQFSVSGVNTNQITSGTPGSPPPLPPPVDPKPKDEYKDDPKEIPKQEEEHKDNTVDTEHKTDTPEHKTETETETPVVTPEHDNNNSHDNSLHDAIDKIINNPATLPPVEPHDIPAPCNEHSGWSDSVNEHTTVTPPASETWTEVVDHSNNSDNSHAPAKTPEEILSEPVVDHSVVTPAVVDSPGNSEGHGKH